MSNFAIFSNNFDEPGARVALIGQEEQPGVVLHPLAPGRPALGGEIHAVVIRVAAAQDLRTVVCLRHWPAGHARFRRSPDCRPCRSRSSPSGSYFPPQAESARRTSLWRPMVCSWNPTSCDPSARAPSGSGAPPGNCRRASSPALRRPPRRIVSITSGRCGPVLEAHQIARGSAIVRPGEEARLRPADISDAIGHVTRAAAPHGTRPADRRRRPAPKGRRRSPRAPVDRR